MCDRRQGSMITVASATAAVSVGFHWAVREGVHAKDQRPEYCAHHRRGWCED
jgi:hypothetical protein